MHMNRPGLGVVAEKSYRWGKFQAWMALVIAIAQFLLVRLPLSLVVGVLFLCFWRGLLRKRRYGFVLVYVVAGLAIFAGLLHLAVKPTWDVFSQLLIAVCVWGIPAGFYYPKRYREFGFGAKQQISEAQSQPEPEPQAKAAAAAFGSAGAEKPEGIRLVDYEEWREAVAVARVKRLIEERSKK
jgi:hypothetical protein